VLFTPLAISAIAYVAWVSRHSFFELLMNVNLFLLSVCVLVNCILHLLPPVFTIATTANIPNNKLNYASALRIQCNRLPARYLPGGIWQSAARAYDYRSYGLNLKQITVYFLMENVLTAVTGLFFGSLMLMIATQYLGYSVVNYFPINSFFIFSLIILIVLPYLYNRYIVKYKGVLTFEQYSISIASLFAYRLLAAVAFVLYIKAFPDLQITISVFESIAVYIYSWSIGFVAVFAPQGIGVSELVVSQLIRAGDASKVFITLLVAFRITILLADIITWSVTRVYIKNNCKQH
jgi:hypothetical protein